MNFIKGLCIKISCIRKSSCKYLFSKDISQGYITVRKVRDAHFGYCLVVLNYELQIILFLKQFLIAFPFHFYCVILGHLQCM